MRRLTIIFILVGMLVSTVNAQEAMTARKWLDRMSRSDREQNYQGVFTYQSGDTMESLRITHGVINAKEFERLEYLDGKKREVDRRGHELNCIHPGHRLIRLSPDPDEADRQYSRLENFYRITLAGETRVAGHQAVIVSVLPRDIYRLGYRLYLDKETGLLLKAELIENGSQKVLERFQFVEINIGIAIDETFFAVEEGAYEAKHAGAESMDQTGITNSGKSWLVNWLPAGFNQMVDNRAPDMASFTDGLAVFSVFLEVAGYTDNSDAQIRKGATVVYSQGLMVGAKPYQVTVVGEIPSQTARKIAESVTLVVR